MFISFCVDVIVKHNHVLIEDRGKIIIQIEKKERKKEKRKKERKKERKKRKQKVIDTEQ